MRLLDDLILPISNYLMEEIKTGNFYRKRHFYAASFTAASFKLLNKENKIQKDLISYYKKHGNQLHQEFNYFALQILYNNKLETSLYFPGLFIKKVTNWILLRSLVRIKQGGAINKIISILQSAIILTINQSGGYYTDNTIRMFYKKNRSISSQYHIFATMLTGEIFRKTNISFFKNKFFNGLKTLVGEVEYTGEIKMIGRGKKQIFGYGSAICALSIAYDLNKDEKYLKKIRKILTYLKKYIKKNGEVPLVLMSENQKKYWESYNNLYDYESFLLLLLIMSKKILKKYE